MICTHDIIEKDNACADGLCPICLAAEIKRIKVTWRDEPARQPDYRRAYTKMHDRLANQESCITWLLVELRALQKRVNQLEAWRARSHSEMADPALSTDRQLAQRNCGEA